MPLSDIVTGGPACGPSNPLQSLGKRFGQDRSTQLDRFDAGRGEGSSGSGAQVSLSPGSRAGHGDEEEEEKEEEEDEKPANRSRKLALTRDCSLHPSPTLLVIPSTTSSSARPDRSRLFPPTSAPACL